MSASTLDDRLRHIVEALDAIQQFTRGRSQAEFDRDAMLRDAVERNLERLSEASRYIPVELTALRPEVPWRQVADLGNTLRHAYDRIAAERIWAIVLDDLPPLRAAIVALRQVVGRKG